MSTKNAQVPMTTLKSVKVGGTIVAADSPIFATPAMATEYEKRGLARLGHDKPKPKARKAKASEALSKKASSKAANRENK